MSINGKTVSLKTIVERVYMDYGFNYNLSWNEAAEWAGSFLALLRAPVSLESKFKIIKITDYRGDLPCDLETITTCAFIPNGAKIVPNSAYVYIDKGTYLADTVSIDLINREAVIALSYKNGQDSIGDLWNLFPGLIPMRYDTSTMMGKYHNNLYDFSINSDYTYKVNTNKIFTNFKDGCIVMAYNAIPLDDEGYPLIPSEEKWRRAVKEHIALMIAKKLWYKGELADKVYNEIKSDSLWSTQQAGIETLSIDKLTSFKNSWVRLIPKPHQEDNFFSNLQLPEQRYNHPLRFNL